MSFRFAAVIVFTAVLSGFAAAQPSHLHNLIETYKAQNPGAAQRMTEHQSREKDGEQNPPILVASNPPQSPVLGSPPEKLAAPPGGNPKDPLNPRFVPNAVPDKGQDNSRNPYAEWQKDACLNDIFFLDNNCGWAAGDRGTVWNTPDGGQTWTLQETPLDCQLHCIRFKDVSFGIAVGGYYYPSGNTGGISGGTAAHLNRSRGVILITQDGGRKWSLIATPYFPALKQIEIIDTMQIRVNGEPSDLYPNGTFTSNDAGRTWKYDAEPRAVKPVPEMANVPLLQTLCSEHNGKEIFAAGLPGTMIYSATNSASTKWKATPTGNNAPLHKIVFLNEKTGWAAGELGTILKTGDGGASWNVQTTGGKKLAVLGLFGTANDVPLEAFVSLCAHQGYLGGISLLFQERNCRQTAGLDVHEAFIRTGASVDSNTGTLLECREMFTAFDELVKQIQKQHDNKGMEHLRAQLVGLIRTWQPEIILTADAPKDGIVRELALREIMDAVRKAEDPAAYPNQMTELGLKPWQVKKVHVAVSNGTLGDVNLNTKEPSIRLGLPFDEAAYISYGLLNVPRNRQAMLGFSTPHNVVPPSASKDFFAGIEIQPGSDSRRLLAGSYAEQWEQIQLRIQQRQQTLGIIASTANTAKKNKQKPGDIRLASSAEELTRKIDSDAAVQILLEMGESYKPSGDWASVSEAYEVIAKHYPQHPLARPAFLWLMQQYACGEKSENKPLAEVNASLDAAIAMERYLAQYFPDLAAMPEVKFSLASALRQRGFEQDAGNLYRELANRPFNGIWKNRAKGECFLSAPSQNGLENPQQAIRCSFTSVKPYLDGKFDKEFDRKTWFHSKLYSLTPDKPNPSVAAAGSQNFGTKIMTMYDRDYFYIGLKCRRVAGFSYPPLAEKPRQRDVPLDDQDRVEILLDVDRDYQTCYSFTADSRGWAVDALRGSTTWNPSWYVARYEDKDSYYIEAAIPWESLTNYPPQSGTVWAVGVRRIVPGKGIECWNAENADDLTNGFGFLVFE
ncbi:MAG: hypothetical protein LBN39_03125 [Planctomycetaceae bacterium]|jgi:photosystem II stability/assembly factor-like uncharacterized protein|nr:hypothetical protein [Planctomycetaceae bacterium]